MKIRKVIDKAIRRDGDGTNIVGDITGSIAANVGEEGGTTHVSSRQTIVQRDGRTVVHSEKSEKKEES